jgi:hypothetical protein
MAAKWTAFACDVGQALLVAPAEVALAWTGAHPKSSGRMVIHFSYWNELVNELPAELVPAPVPGKPKELALVVEKAAVPATIEKLVAFAKRRYPDARAETSYSTTMIHRDEGYMILQALAEPPSSSALAAGKGKPVWTQPHGEHTALFWRAMLASELHVRLEREGLTLVDTTAEPREVEDVLATATPAKHGSWAFDSGVAVAMWALVEVTEVDGFARVKQPAQLAAAVAKKPLVVKPKAAFAKVAPGTYLATSGGDRTTRWLRLQRA